MKRRRGKSPTEIFLSHSSRDARFATRVMRLLRGHGLRVWYSPAHIIGAHATEMIHELAVARENEFTVEEVDLAIHAHPTMSEAVAQAALDSMGKVLDA